jgi:hypothetical protein
MEDIESRGDRPRDDSGRFVAKNQTETVSETPVEETPETVEPVVPVEEKTETFEVPQELQRLGLRKEEAKAFMEAPEIVRNAFMRRSEEMHKGIEGFRESAQFGQTVQKAIDPFRATIASLGVQPEQAIQSLFVADHKLRYGSQSEKISAFQTLAQQYGVDLTQAQPQEEVWVDPTVKDLQGRLQQMESMIQQQKYQEQQREQLQLKTEIEKFASDPAHVHFEAVKSHMSALLQSGVAKDLHEAYEQAIYANPTIRTQVIAQQQAEAEAKRKAEVTAKAQEAKRSAAVNVPRTGSSAPKGPISNSMDDTLRGLLAARGGVL